MAKDFDFYVRDAAGTPIYFVQHHETHSHNGMCPHEHWISMKDVTIADISKGGDLNRFRQDVRPAKWA